MSIVFKESPLRLNSMFKYRQVFMPKIDMKHIPFRKYYCNDAKFVTFAILEKNVGSSDIVTLLTDTPMVSFYSLFTTYIEKAFEKVEVKDKDIFHIILSSSCIIYIQGPSGVWMNHNMLTDTFPSAPNYIHVLCLSYEDKSPLFFRLNLADPEIPYIIFRDLFGELMYNVNAKISVDALRFFINIAKTRYPNEKIQWNKMYGWVDDTAKFLAINNTTDTLESDFRQLIKMVGPLEKEDDSWDMLSEVIESGKVPEIGTFIEIDVPGISELISMGQVDSTGHLILYTINNEPLKEEEVKMIKDTLPFTEDTVVIIQDSDVIV